MRFLADESCDFAAVRALCEAGHEVLTVADVAPASEDQAVVNLIDRIGDRIKGRFVVLQPGRARITG